MEIQLRGVREVSFEEKTRIQRCLSKALSDHFDVTAAVWEELEGAEPVLRCTLQPLSPDACCDQIDLPFEDEGFVITVRRSPS